MPEPRRGELVVGVGDCRIGSAPDGVLSTYALGSCLAVLVYDWKLKSGGLLHVMLPDSSIDKARSASRPFVYVDTGVPELFRLMEERGSSRHRVRCCIVGGASMMADSDHFEIGKRNYLALKKAFWRMGVFADREDVGGTESRSVRLDLQTGRIDMKKGAGQERIFVPAAVSVPGRTVRDAGIGR